ncbi:hypothetical protein CRUP_001915 [Coryphaenoides rupestris]|nr:hypothetical protein CRUP_001915 [Coryphaenoides rupestris]
MVIEAEGHLVIPGGIDVNTCLMKGPLQAQPVDDFFVGTKAALASGTTMIIDHVTPQPGESLLEAFERWQEAADTKSCCDYSLHVDVPQWHHGIKEELEQLVQEKGVNSFQLYMTYKDLYQMTDSQLYSAFYFLKELGQWCWFMLRTETSLHSFLGLSMSSVWTPQLEAEAVFRAVTLGKRVNCPVYITKVMSKSAADVIAQARRKDPSTPDHLHSLLACGDLEVVGSAHCAYSISQKAVGRADFTSIPEGANWCRGEDGCSLAQGCGLYRHSTMGKMDENQFVAVTSTNAAKIFNIYPRKGRIAAGSDADIVIWDPDKVQTITAKLHQSVLEYNIMEGLECHGGVVVVVSRGQVVYEDEQLKVQPGAGRFISRLPFPDHAYQRIHLRNQVWTNVKVLFH